GGDPGVAERDTPIGLGSEPRKCRQHEQEEDESRPAPPSHAPPFACQLPSRLVVGNITTEDGPGLAYLGERRLLRRAVSTPSRKARTAPWSLTSPIACMKA